MTNELPARYGQVARNRVTGGLGQRHGAVGNRRAARVRIAARTAQRQGVGTILGQAAAAADDAGNGQGRRTADGGVGDQANGPGESHVARVDGLQGAAAVADAVQVERLVDSAGQPTADAQDGPAGHQSLYAAGAQGIDVLNLQGAHVDVGLAGIRVARIKNQETAAVLNEHSTAGNNAVGEQVAASVLLDSAAAARQGKSSG